ncbi:MAG: amidohydrolase family protein [Anditalea sp.]
MKDLEKHTYLSLLILLVLFQNCSQEKNLEEGKENSGSAYYTVDDFATVEKFDSHNHFNFLNTAFIEQAEKDNFRLLNITDDRPFGLPMEDQQKIAVQLVEDFSSTIAYATTFSVKDWNNEEWEEKTLSDLKNSFSKGAVAVKAWKNIGMDLKDENGKFVMIDHPKFDLILDYLAKKGIPLIGHLGEPKDCWLPIEEMTIKGNQSYYSKHPEYHMYRHPEYPSYEDQIRARDEMLEKHPDLKFIGAHLGSLEWSLDELAKRLGRFPNMAVDLARMSNLQNHAMTDWQKTHDFFIKYQDRLIYATDRAVGETLNPSEMKKNVHESRIRDWKFFTTDEKMVSSGFDGEFKGLKLLREVIDKIYRKNAEEWIPELK